MKKITAVLCTFTLLCSISACGVERPDLEIAAKEQADGSADNLKKFEIKDSNVTTDLSDKFHIKAVISGNDVSKASSYELTNFKMSEDQVANLFFPGGGFKREDFSSGAAEYTKEKETLDVHFVDMSSMAIMSSPNITYYLDKGKEYGGIINYCWAEDKPSDADQEKAVDLVKDKLDKLGLEYGDLKISKVSHDTMNGYYIQAAKWIQELKEEAESSDTGDTSYDALLYSQGYYQDLDENFQFTAEDDCYVINGYLQQKGIPVVDHGFQTVNIRAAVSSRGIEYLFVDNLYSAENEYGGASVVPVEKAADALFKAYGSSAIKDKSEITVDKISLSYQKDYSYGESVFNSKTFIVPVWTVSYHIDDEDSMSRSCNVSAADGNLMDNADTLFLSEPVLSN